jgi:hypothetical protein
MFHGTEQSIIDRLTGQLPEGTRLLRHAELDEATDARQLAPFVAIVYDGFTPGEFVPPGYVQKINQEWYVVVGTKSAKKNGKNLAARDAAGELAETILGLLLGYAIKNASGSATGAYLRLRESPGPEYQDGYCYLPIGFTSSVTFKGNS